MLPYALLGHGVSGVHGPDVPGQGLGGVLAEVCKVVREGAAVQRVAGDTDRGPELQEFPAGGGDVAGSPFGDGLADGLPGRVGAGGSSGHGWPALMGMATVVRSPRSAERIVTGCSG